MAYFTPVSLMRTHATSTDVVPTFASRIWLVVREASRGLSPLLFFKEYTAFSPPVNHIALILEDLPGHALSPEKRICGTYTPSYNCNPFSCCSMPNPPINICSESVVNGRTVPLYRRRTQTCLYLKNNSMPTEKTPTSPPHLKPVAVKGYPPATAPNTASIRPTSSSTHPASTQFW